MLEQDKRLLIISELARISVTEHATKTILQRLLACLVDTFEPAEAGLLFLCDPPDQWLALDAAHGYDLTKLDQILSLIHIYRFPGS